MLQYGAPLFLAAFLLFQVQPVIARCILPWFGGAPSVWTTCMLFFQSLLVLGYGYSHYLTDRLRPRAQAVVHTALLVVSLALLGCMALAWGAPLVPPATWRPEGSAYPVLNILRLLLVSVGLPYFVVATTSPLMQAWFSRAAPGVSPYRLYSLSNVGSLLALLTYPVLVEPNLAQRQQAWAWSGGFALFAVGCVLCAVSIWRLIPGGEAGAAAQGAELPAEAEEAPPTFGTKTLWVALPALASLLLLAVTNHLCQDVAVTPFLWVLPLSLYLLSFIICFDHERWYFRPAFIPLLLVAVPVALGLLPYARKVPLPWQILAFSLTLFVCCMACHGELVARKPAPRHLTAFYLAVSVGGALGGILVGLLAPHIFRTYAELPIGLVLCYLVGVFVPVNVEGPWRITVNCARVALIAVAVVLALLPRYQATKWKDIRVLDYSRNFYGVLRVEERLGQPGKTTHMLLHGRIIHGFQYINPKLRRMPTSYYGPDSGIALAVNSHPQRRAGKELRVGVLGLGVGTMAAFCRKGDTLRFYEINPEVLRQATDSRLFTYLQDCPATHDVVMGDGRLSLEHQLARGEPQRFDLLLLDAFSGDAVPAHLLTREAFEMYLKHLRPGGALCVDVSNAVLDLPPVIWKVAENLGLDGVAVTSSRTEHTYYSTWMILTPQRSYLRGVKIPDAEWSYTGNRRVRLWTDDYYNLFQIMKR